MKNTKEKIIESIHNGTLINQTLRKFEEPHNITNRTAFEIEVQSRISKKMKKEFGSILNKHYNNQSVATSNIIWTCWLQGLREAPEIVKVCVASLKKLEPRYKVIVLDKDNLKKYVRLPNYIINKFERGIISPAQYTDLIRTYLLCEVGGVWIDSTVLFTGKTLPNYIENEDLFLYKNIVNAHNDLAILCSSWLISAKPKHPILLMTRDLMWEYWKKYNYCCNYYIWHIMFSLAAQQNYELWEKVPTIPNAIPHLLQMELNKKFEVTRWNELVKMCDIHKLTYKGMLNDNKNSVYSHILECSFM